MYQPQLQLTFITQDILFSHWILYPFACLFRTHSQIRHPCRSQPAHQVPPWPLRPCLFHRRYCGWSHCNFLLESCPVWYRCMGRLRLRTMDTMFPQWRSHQAYRIEVDPLHWFVPFIHGFIALLTLCLTLSSLRGRRVPFMYHPQGKFIIISIRSSIHLLTHSTISRYIITYYSSPRHSLVHRHSCSASTVSPQQALKRYGFCHTLPPHC